VHSEQSYDTRWYCSFHELHSTCDIRASRGPELCPLDKDGQHGLFALDAVKDPRIPRFVASTTNQRLSIGQGLPQLVVMTECSNWHLAKLVVIVMGDCGLRRRRRRGAQSFFFVATVNKAQIATISKIEGAGAVSQAWTRQGNTEVLFFVFFPVRFWAADSSALSQRCVLLVDNYRVSE